MCRIRKEAKTATGRSVERSVRRGKMVAVVEKVGKKEKEKRFLLVAAQLLDPSPLTLTPHSAT